MSLGMAWRIDEAVVRGEIDNRERGRVRARIWFVGREEPVVLELKGDAWRDVAGRLLQFENPRPKPMDLAGIDATQTGTVGDVTASRKVKVPDIPMDQIGAYYAAKKPWPWHWGNALYLEWFSEANGRVVIESASYRLSVDGDARWDMTEAEEQRQREANGRTMATFMDLPGGAATANDLAAAADLPVKRREGAPMTEAEAEVWQARQDLLIDRVMAHLEREGDGADYDLILRKEMERLRRERGEPEPPADWERDEAWAEELHHLEDAMLENADLNEEDETDFPDEAHPLVERAKNLFLDLNEYSEEENWLPESAMSEHPVAALINATMSVGPKLAGALNRGPWPPELENCAHKIVRLKRARGHLDDALLAAESCQEDKLIRLTLLGPFAVELIDLAQDIDHLIAELRDRLGETEGG
jgi:hypothetical protein